MTFWGKNPAIYWQLFGCFLIDIKDVLTRRTGDLYVVDISLGNPRENPLYQDIFAFTFPKL